LGQRASGCSGPGRRFRSAKEGRKRLAGPKCRAGKDYGTVVSEPLGHPPWPSQKRLLKVIIAINMFGEGGVRVSSEPWELVESPSRYDDYNWYSDDVSVRKFYLFLAEIGRRLRHLMTDPGPIKMIDLCEQCAEGQLTEYELSDLADAHRANAPGQSYAADVADNLYFWVADRYKVNTRSFYYAANVFAAQAAVEAGLLTPEADYHEEVQAVLKQPRFAAIWDGTAREWGVIVRDIYGPNPFRTPASDSRWRTPTVIGDRKSTRLNSSHRL